MRTTEVTASIRELVLSSEQSARRTPGVHVSDVLGYMKRLLAKQGQWPDTELDNAAQIGRIWETMMARMLAEAANDDHRYVRPGEFELDGIIGSPDCIDVTETAVVEFKATWVSSRHEILIRRPDYKWQLMSYCEMTTIPVGRLIVLYLNGDYKPPMPIVKGWQYEFKGAELRQNWQMILRNRDDMLKEA